MQEDEVRQLLCDAVWLLLSVRETVELNEGLRLRVRVGDGEEEGEALVEGVPHGVGENVTEAVSESDKRAGEAEEGGAAAAELRPKRRESILERGTGLRR